MRCCHLDNFRTIFRAATLKFGGRGARLVFWKCFDVWGQDVMRVFFFHVVAAFVAPLLRPPVCETVAGTSEETFTKSSNLTSGS